VSKVRVRWVGHVLEASFAITVDCDATVGQGHAIAEAVRHRLLHDIAKLDTIVIHVNPCGHDGVDPHEALAHHDTRAVPAH
jgi:divalent metal cation (Fe/Co/Zn/Cd) transporter